jgi:hypothetical protein
VRFSGIAAAMALMVGRSAWAQTNLGDTSAALPGIHRVGVAAVGRPRISGALTTGYGLTEAQSESDGTHHRFLAIPAIGFVPMRWVQGGFRADIRYDRHAEGEDGVVADPRFLLRAGEVLNGGFHLGAEAGVWVPGTETSGASFEAISPELRVLGALDRGRFLAASHVGYRFDRSKAAGADADRLSFSDRLSVGLNEFDAALFGLGFAYGFGRTEALFEVSADVFVGSGAPAVTQSPLRASAGLRHAFFDSLALELLAEAVMSARPDLGPDAPLVAVEPRFTILTGLRSRFELVRASSVDVPRDRVESSPTETPAPEPPETIDYTITVVDEAGNPIAGARVQIQAGDVKREAVEPKRGHYLFADVTPGRVTLTVQSDKHEPVQRDVEIGQRSGEALQIRVDPLLPSAQLRGLVRSADRKPLKASIRIEPLAVEVTTDADGFFEVDVLPGKYDVVIDAAGYRPQSRRIEVEKDGVFVINAELFKRR